MQILLLFLMSLSIGIVIYMLFRYVYLAPPPPGEYHLLDETILLDDKEETIPEDQEIFNRERLHK